MRLSNSNSKSECGIVGETLDLRLEPASPRLSVVWSLKVLKVSVRS